MPVIGGIRNAQYLRAEQGLLLDQLGDLAHTGIGIAEGGQQAAKGLAFRPQQTQRVCEAQHLRVLESGYLNCSGRHARVIGPGPLPPREPDHSSQ